MAKILLQAEKRPEQSVASLRKAGFLPAIIYGQNKNTENLAVKYNDFQKVFKKAGESTLIDLVIEGKTHNVIIHDIQKHYLHGNFLHADFFEVSMTEKLKAKVPLEFTGVSKAVKENGGVLVTVLDEIEVECLPAALPHSIVVDIASLNTFADSIHVRDLKLSAEVTVLTPHDETVVKVAPPRDIEKELAEPVVEDVSKVEGAAETPKEADADKAEPDKAEKTE